jgi:hypothetical protein
MRKLLYLFLFTLILTLSLNACSKNPVKPKKESKPFPLTFKFLNKNDSTIPGGFDVYLAVFYPRVDSTHYKITGLNNPAVGSTLGKSI